MDDSGEPLGLNMSLDDLIVKTIKPRYDNRRGYGRHVEDRGSKYRGRGGGRNNYDGHDYRSSGGPERRFPPRDRQEGIYGPPKDRLGSRQGSLRKNNADHEDGHTFEGRSPNRVGGRHGFRNEKEWNQTYDENFRGNMYKEHNQIRDNEFHSSEFSGRGIGRAKGVGYGGRNPNFGGRNPSAGNHSAKQVGGYRPVVNIPARKETVKQEEDTMDVVVHLEPTNIVRVKPTGEIVLLAGDDNDSHTLQRMNAALNVMGLKVSSSSVDPTQWTVSDGRALLRRFTEGMVIPPAPGQAGKGRGLALLKGMQQKGGTTQAQAKDASYSEDYYAGGWEYGGGGGYHNRYAPY